MTSIKLTQLKTKLKHYTPEITVGVIVATAIGYLVYLSKDDGFPLEITKEDINRMRETGDQLVFKNKKDTERIRVVYTSM
jgi:hypothetical protein